MYVNSDKSSYQQVGFNWNMKLTGAISGPNKVQCVDILKEYYSKMFIKMDQTTENWENQVQKEISEKSDEGYAGSMPQEKMKNFLMRRYQDTDDENICMQGGDVVLDGNGVIQKVFYMLSVSDRVSMEDLGLV